MKCVKVALMGLVAATAVMASQAGSAEAQRRMAVLIDASGSMTTTRMSDGRTRFDAAKTVSEEAIVEQSMDGLAAVAVYTFQDAGITLRSATAANPSGWVSPSEAITAIRGLSGPTGITPLAGSMCDVLDILAAQPSGSTSQRIIQVSSDGEENATPAAHPCYGPTSLDPNEPFSLGSWQNLVYQRATNHPSGVPMIVRVDIFNNSQITSLARRSARTVDLEPGAPAPRAAFAMTAAAASDQRPPTLAEFFGALARATGGQVRIVEDAAPLPVYGDLTSDYCVDTADAFEIIRRFGQRTPTVDGKYDFDLDGVVGFSDYLIVSSKITGTCGAPDTLAEIQPIRCWGFGNVVIEGKSLETDGTAIDVRGACRLTIKNSRIVSGGTAITVSGGARIVIEDSIIAGQGHVLMVNGGAAALSSKGTYYKGTKRVNGGALGYLDLGGNTWED